MAQNRANDYNSGPNDTGEMRYTRAIITLRKKLNRCRGEDKSCENNFDHYASNKTSNDEIKSKVIKVFSYL